MNIDLQRSFTRTFVPANADMGDWAQIEPLFKTLLARRPDSVGDLEQWLKDCSELWSAIGEERSKRHIAMTSHTDDPASAAAHQRFIEDIEPHVKSFSDAIEKAYLENPVRSQLPSERYALMDRKIANSAALYREENVPIETQESLLESEYHKTMGAMTVTVDGAELTPDQASKYLEERNRSVREQVWRQIVTRRLQDKDSLDTIYDRLVRLRTEIAANAGFPNYRDYMFRRMERFDYTPDDCFRYHEAVERAVVPVLRNILQRRQKLLKLDVLRPWDRQVDPLDRPPLRPFANAAELVRGTREIFSRVHPAFGSQFEFLVERGLLDLESRKGKAPGGYQATLSEQRVPFIFMNAAGRDGDIRTLVHEGGHAFHMLAARDEPLLHYRHAPTEFCEVASMGMELLATPHLGSFYKRPEDCNRSYRTKLEEVVQLFSTIATGDAFQHWIYTHPDHTRAERSALWRQLVTRYVPVENWDGLEEEQASSWHRIIHFFAYPFYLMEYAIAQIGALQVWLRSRQNYSEAVERYWSALVLGGSRTLPDLFEAAGGHFGFDYKTLHPLMDAVEEELAKLSE
jgi:oligoendopeptidase F